MYLFITIFFIILSLIVCFYMKNRYENNMRDWSTQMDELYAEHEKEKLKALSLESKLISANRELSSLKEQFAVLVDINRELTSKAEARKVESEKTTNASEAHSDQSSESNKKRGRKPGFKKSFYNKKAGGK